MMRSASPGPDVGRASHASHLPEPVGWTTRHAKPRRLMSWRTVYRLTAAGRPPITLPPSIPRLEETSSP